MPYIVKEKRSKLDSFVLVLSQVLKSEGLEVGDLNYVITSLIHQWTQDKGLRYGTLNDVEGVLACVSKEFSRQVVSPYEDKKKKENGHVSRLDDPNTADPSACRAAFAARAIIETVELEGC